jgi:sugar phosphate permease
MSYRHFLHFLITRIFGSVKGRIFYGWWIVILGSLISAVGTGILFYGFTVFFLPLKRDFAVSSAAISLLYGAARLRGGIEGPIVGHLIDKFGPRTMIFAGASMTGVGLILLAMTRSFWSFFFIYIFIVSLGYNAGFFHPISTAVNNWFIRHRGVAFSCISASANFGAMLIAPLLSYIILNFGWRAGAVTAGLIILVVGLPAALPIHRSPEVVGLHPDGEPSHKTELQQSDPIRPQAVDFDFSVKEALRTVTYWMLMGTISLRLFVTVALNTHFIPILVWRGVSETTAAYLLSLFAFSTIFTMLVLGWMGDRWDKSLLCSLCIVPTIGVMVGLTLSRASPFIYFFPIALAITMGIAPLNWALIGDFFGRRAYATLRGIMGICYGTATFVSPVYAGWIYDATGSYKLVLITFSIILLFAASFFAILRPPSLTKAKKEILRYS